MKVSEIKDAVASFGKRLWLACLPEHKRALREYRDALRMMGVAYCYSYLSYDPEIMARYILAWVAAEANCARLNMRTFGLWAAARWVNGNLSEDLPIGSLREEGETPIFYAQKYYDRYCEHGMCTPEDGPQLDPQRDPCAKCKVPDDETSQPMEA